MVKVTKFTIGEKLRGLRDKFGRSQEDIANVLGIPRVSVSQVENGRRELSSIELARLAEYFGVPVERLLGGFGEREEIKFTKEDDGGSERIAIPKLNAEKFKQVLLYMLEKVAGKPNVGQTVLYKLLYFADFNYYERFEEQLTGAKYIKNHYGPTPTSFERIITKMIEDCEVKSVRSTYYNKCLTRFFPLKKADLRVINGAEKEVIDDVINKLSDMNATQISAYSHEDVPWTVTGEGETIDYETVFYREPQYSVREYSEL